MLLKLRQAFEEGGDLRPPLYQWMSSNYDELVTLFNDARVNWKHLTTSFTEMGFQNGVGGDLRPETVRQTWYRVRTRKETVRARKAPRIAPVEVLSSPAPAPRPSTPIPSPTSPAPVTAATDAMAALMAEMNRRSGRI
jgi:hypothetical protein